MNILTILGLGIFAFIIILITRKKDKNLMNQPQNEPLENEFEEKLYNNSEPVSVYLVSTGNNKLGILKEMRSICNVGLREGKEIIENTPSLIASQISLTEAEAIKNTLKKYGAVVEIRQ